MGGKGEHSRSRWIVERQNAASHGIKANGIISMNISSDQVVVVTGAPRSGTSLLMQTLVALGVPVAGERFPIVDLGESDSPVGNAPVSSKYLNPRGFYEVSGVVMRGLREVGDYGGQAIKVVSSASYPRLGFGMPSEFVRRYVLCLRDPRSVAVSQTLLKRPWRVAGESEWERAPVGINPTRFLAEYGGLARYLSQQDETVRSRWLVVDYDAFLLSPSQVVDRLISHLGLEVTADARTTALANVDPALSRSERENLWPSALAEAGELASGLYLALRKFDLSSLQSISDRVIAYEQQQRLEHARWYDESIGVLVIPSLHRALAVQPTLRAQYTAVFAREKQNGLHPCTAPDYEEPLDAPMYVIERPSDLGPLQRSMVRYRGELLTREQAFVLHQHLRINPQISIGESPPRGQPSVLMN